jgi:diguanylate cyclase (GGDEF)-like protein
MRVLMADDDQGVLDAYKIAFESLRPCEKRTALSAMAHSLFADACEVAEPEGLEFDVACVDQGLAAVAAVEEALSSGLPFQIVFLDMRMPPGIDGKETARRIRAADPNIHIVLVTGYSDHSLSDVAKVAGPIDRLCYLAKPFEIDEIVHLARALNQKWCVERDLRQALESLRTQVGLLEQSNLQLAASEATTRHAAFHDALTSAPNRAAFMHELAERIHAPQKTFSIAILDLDRFKVVNDTFGHAAGDELVRSVWQAVHAVLPHGALGARMGGDEFGLVLPFDDDAAIARLCESLIEVCTKERSIFGHPVQVGASIGVAKAAPEGERDSIDIVRRADLALYAAKRGGRGRYYLYDRCLDESVRFRQHIETGLRHAIASGELSLMFQPIVGQDGLEAVGFEALVRWESPEHGPIAPSLFVPIAEESNLIHDLSDWVVPRALAACKSWPSQFVSINFSPRQFRRPALVEKLQAAVADAGLKPDRVQIEITETALFDDAESAAQLLTKLQSLGFRVALDDFGTGYSSLFNLKNFSIDCIKIDRSFIAALGKEENSTAIVTSITQLGRSMGLSIVAEGVEDSYQHQALRLAGCSHMQGYLFGRPLAEAAAFDLANQDDAHRRTSSATRV